MPSKRVNPPALGHGPKGGEPPDDSGRGQIWQIGRATVRLFLAAVLFLITVLHTTEAYGHGAELMSAGSSSWSFIAQLAVEGWYYGTHLKHDWAAVYRCRSCVPMIWKVIRRVLRRIWHKLTER